MKEHEWNAIAIFDVSVGRSHFALRYDDFTIPGALMKARV